MNANQNTDGVFVKKLIHQHWDTTMSTQMLEVIHAYHGYVYETAGLVLAFFCDIREARECAVMLQALADMPEVEIEGSQLTLSVGGS